MEQSITAGRTRHFWQTFLFISPQIHKTDGTIFKLLYFTISKILAFQVSRYRPTSPMDSVHWAPRRVESQYARMRVRRLLSESRCGVWRRRWVAEVRCEEATLWLDITHPITISTSVGQCFFHLRRKSQQLLMTNALQRPDSRTRGFMTAFQNPSQGLSWTFRWVLNSNIQEFQEVFKDFRKNFRVLSIIHFKILMILKVLLGRFQKILWKA